MGGTEQANGVWSDRNARNPPPSPPPGRAGGWLLLPERGVSLHLKPVPLLGETATTDQARAGREEVDRTGGVKMALLYY